MDPRWVVYRAIGLSGYHPRKDMLILCSTPSISPTRPGWPELLPFFSLHLSMCVLYPLELPPTHGQWRKVSSERLSYHCHYP